MNTAILMATAEGIVLFLYNFENILEFSKIFFKNQIN